MSEHWQAMSTAWLRERLRDLVEAMEARAGANRWDPELPVMSAESVQIYAVLAQRERAEAGAS